MRRIILMMSMLLAALIGGYTVQAQNKGIIELKAVAEIDIEVVNTDG